MEVKTTATITIEEDVAMTSNGPFRIANGVPIRTANFFDKIVGAVHQIEAELGQDMDIALYFGTHGVTVLGATK